MPHDISFINNNQKIKIDISNLENQSKYNLLFSDVNLNSFTNENSSIVFDGVIDGRVSFLKKNEIYSGNSTLLISNLKSNSKDLGDAILKT